MLNKLFFSFILTLSCFSLFCQSKFQPGYIVESSGDSTFGFTMITQSKPNPTLVYFKSSETGESKDYTASDILAFGVGELIFESAKVFVNELFEKNQSFNSLPKIEYAERQVFLLSLVGGPRPLYYYAGMDKAERFYISNANEFQLLEYQEYYTNGGVERKSINKFQGQLSAYLSSCSSINKVISQNSYSKRGLLRVFNAYKNCSENSGIIIRRAQLEKDKPIFRIITGLANTYMSSPSSFDPFLDRTEFPTSSDLAIGLSYEQQLSSNKRISWKNNLLYTRFQSKGEDLEVFSSISSILRQWSLGYSYFKFQSIFQYNIPMTKGRIFFGTGINLGFAILQVNEEVRTDQFSSTFVVKKNEFITENSPTDFGFLLSTGITRNRFELELRYESTLKNPRTGSSSVDIRRTYLLLGYQLFK